jgi:hypothetical protein
MAIEEKAAAKKDIPLTSDLLQSVESDYTLKTLINTRLSLFQERAAAVLAQTSGPSSNNRQVKEIDARIAEVDNQISDTRNRLTKDTGARYLTLLHDDAVSKRNRADYLNKMRKDQENRIASIGQNLLTWDQRVDEVKAAGDIVKNLRAQLSLEQANRAADDSRVAQFGEAVMPDKPDP